MNQNDSVHPWGLNLKPISLFFFIMSSSSSTIPYSSDPLFSFVAALYALILLYFPTILCFSPVILAAAIALLCLLRFGTLQKTEHTEKFGTLHRTEHTETRDDVAVEEIVKFEKQSTQKPDPDWFSFVQWDVGAPLEVIYEEGEDCDSIGRNGGGIRRYPSLSMYYPESDSDSSSDGGEFGGGGGFSWEEDDGEGMLIEIDLDRKDDGEKKGFDRWGINGEEENMIEIDISPGRLVDGVFSGEACDL